ncbi:MAG: hypothetical protein P8L77_05325 [Gammaproteobacteria bacterium]|nr:hypothetical protein [Gammaproteobacteria bacterium]
MSEPTVSNDSLINQYQPEAISFITTISACINTLYYVSALGMGILNASVVGLTFLVLIAIVVLSISYFVSWIDKKNQENQENQFKILKKISDYSKKSSLSKFPKKILNNLNAIPDSYSWRLMLLLSMCFIADILVSSTILTTFTYLILGSTIQQEFSFQLFLLCCSFLVSLVLGCMRSYNFEALIKNRNKIKNFAKSLLFSNVDPDKPIDEPSLTTRQFLIGIILFFITTIAIFFLLNHILLISQSSLFSAKLIQMITMIESYIHGYALLASLVMGFVVFRIYRSFQLDNPDWQLINSFINIISTYAIVIIFSQKFIILFVTLFSIPISAPQIALANFLIPVIASGISIFHAYSFFTFYMDERELNTNICYMKKFTPSIDFNDIISNPSIDGPLIHTGSNSNVTQQGPDLK